MKFNEDDQMMCERQIIRTSLKERLQIYGGKLRGRKSDVVPIIRHEMQTMVDWELGRFTKLPTMVAEVSKYNVLRKMYVISRTYSDEELWSYYCTNA